MSVPLRLSDTHRLKATPGTAGWPTLSYTYVTEIRFWHVIIIIIITILICLQTT